MEGSGGKRADSQVSGVGHRVDGGGIRGTEGYQGRWKVRARVLSSLLSTKARGEGRGSGEVEQWGQEAGVGVGREWQCALLEWEG